MTPVYSLALPRNPNSCLIKIADFECRALIDTGSDFTLINESSFLKLAKRPQLQPARIVLHAANGQPMTLFGKCELNLNSGGRKIPTEIIVDKDLKRSLI